MESGEFADEMVSIVRVILENDEHLNPTMRYACLVGIVKNSGYTDVEDVFSNYENRKWEFRQNAALELRDAFYEEYELENAWNGDDNRAKMLTNLLPYGDLAFWERLSDVFMPETAEYLRDELEDNPVD